MTRRSTLLLAAIQFAAFWNAWNWVAQRVVEIPENRVGAVALLCALGFIMAGIRGQVASGHPKLGLSAALTLAYAACAPFALPHISAVLATAALAFTLSSFGPPHRRWALAGLLVLALPVIPSMQTHIGYPMRVAAAWLSSGWLGLMGIHVGAQGTCLVWEGRLLLADEACSGIHMLWAGLVLACCVSWLVELPLRRFAALCAATFAAMFAGNVLRFASLFFVEVYHAGDEMHQGTGIAIFAAVCAGLLWLARRMKAVEVPA